MTAQDYSKAVSDIKFLANRFSGVLKVIDRIDELAGVENLIAERKKQLDDLHAKHDRAEADHRTALEAATSVHEAERATLLNKARDEANSVISVMQTLMTRVHDFAMNIKDNAQREADVIKSKTDAARTDYLKLQEDIRQLQDSVSSLIRDQAELARQNETLKERASGYLADIARSEKAKSDLEEISRQNTLLTAERNNLSLNIQELKRERASIADALSSLQKKITG